MKRYLAILAVALSLGGCTTAQIEQGKSIAKQSIDVICASYPVAHAAFQFSLTSGRVPQKVIDREQQAVVALAAICEDPPTDTKTAIASASRVFTALLNAAAEAKKAAQS